MRHRVLSAYVDGRIDKLHVNYIGAEVTEGQPLAEFYSPSLLQAEREYRQLGGELENVTPRCGSARWDSPRADRRPRSKARRLAYLADSRTHQRHRRRQIGLRRAICRRPASNCSSSRDFSTMWFMFRAYEQDMPWIKPGLPVTVTTPSIPNKTFVGKVTFIDPNFDETTRSTKVRVELDNPLVNGRRELLHRLYADGTIELEAPAVLTVPRSAVIETGADAVVYIDKDGGAYEHTVIKTGRRGDTLVEVLSGIKEGDAVVTNGNLLIDGQAEMNRAFMSPPETMPVCRALAALSEEQKVSIADFIKVADAMAAALAADDLAKFNTASEPAMKITGTMVKLLRPNVENLDDLDNARHFHGFEDLKAARIAFHKFSVAATAALEPLRKAGQTPEFQIYECPMVNEGIPGVPKKARWIQTGAPQHGQSVLRK